MKKENWFSGNIYITEENLKMVVSLIKAATYVWEASLEDEGGNLTFLQQIVGGFSIRNRYHRKEILIKKEKLENIIRYLAFRSGKRNLTLSLKNLK